MTRINALIFSILWRRIEAGFLWSIEQFFSIHIWVFCSTYCTRIPILFQVLRLQFIGSYFLNPMTTCEMEWVQKTICIFVLSFTLSPPLSISRSGHTKQNRHNRPCHPLENKENPHGSFSVLRCFAISPLNDDEKQMFWRGKKREIIWLYIANNYLYYISIFIPRSWPLYWCYNGG
jgi:hypothetical protein